MANEPTVIDPRAVWQGQPAERFRLSKSDIGVAIARLEANQRRRPRFMYAVFIFEMVAFAICFVALSGVFQRVGSMLTIAAMAFLIVQLRLHSARMSSSAVNVMKAVRPSVEFYRDNLERRRDFHRGGWFWSRLLAIAPGPLLFMYGFYRDYPGLAVFASLEAAAFVLLLLFSIWLQARIARRYESRIRELTRLEENL